MKLKLFVWELRGIVKSTSLISDLLTQRLSPHWPHLEAKCRCVVNRIALFMSEHHWTCTIFRSSCYQDNKFVSPWPFEMPRILLIRSLMITEMSCNKIQSNRNILSKLHSLKNGKPADVIWLRHQVILLKVTIVGHWSSVSLNRERGDSSDPIT